LGGQQFELPKMLARTWNSRGDSNSVVVMNSAPYHSTVCNIPPGKYANKQDIVDWLQANGCLADISMRKTVLYDFIEKLKPPEKIYKIDQIFNDRGHAAILQTLFDLQGINES
jgi:hypothetical protein